MLVMATVTTRRTNDGLVELRADVQVGRRFMIETRSKRTITMIHVETKVEHRKVCVLATQDDGSRLWIPLELLRIED